MERARLSAARNELGWSQEYVAQQLNVERSTVQRWEHGETAPQPQHLLRLCKLFGKTAQELDLEKDRIVVVVGQYATAEREDTTGPINWAFRTSDLTMRLFRLVWNYPCVDARYQELQAAIILELEDNNSMTFVDDPMSRRDALRRLALMAIEYCGLSALQPVYRRPIEDILSQCTAGITACWHLRKGKDLAFANETVAKYLPTLEDIARTASSQKQRLAAADLAAQGFILASWFADQLSGNSSVSLSYAQQAEHYSEVADNLAMQIVALRAQSNAYDFANNWKQALRATQKAQYLLETNKKTSIPSLLASHVYAALADYQGHTGQKQDVLTSLKKAHTTFFAQPPNEPVPIWIPHSQASLLLHDGLAHFHLGLYKESCDSFAQITDLQVASETTRIEALITQVMAEVQREDTSRDLDRCIDRWKQGIQGATTIQSEQWFNSSIAAFTAMRAAWPTEPHVKDLRQHIVHW